MQLNRYNNNLINDDDFFKLKNAIIIVVIIMLVLVSFYFITKYVLEHKKDNTPRVESVIDRELIMFGQLFNRPDTEYYVIAYNKSGKSKDIYNKYIDKYYQYRKPTDKDYIETLLNINFIFI